MQEFSLDSETINYSFDVEEFSNKVLYISWNPILNCFYITLPKTFNIYPIIKEIFCQ